MKDLKISEKFVGIQGEGPSTGKPSWFIRTYGCPLRCVWCDTPFSYDNTKNIEKLSFDNLLESVREHQIRNIIFTGGEPFAQAKTISEMILGLITIKPNCKFEFETAGIFSPYSLLGTRKEPFLVNLIQKEIQFNVSPKLSNSEQSKDKRYKPEILKEFVDCDNSNFKFVVSNQDDLREVIEIQQECNISNNKIWIMPEGTELNKIIEGGKWLTNFCLEYNWNLSLRNQVVLFNDERGK